MGLAAASLVLRAAIYYWRASRGRFRRQVLALALVCGLLGAATLGALASARRTGSADTRYLRSINSSDVFVNVPGPFLGPLRQIERLPAVQPGGGAVWAGLNANPVIDGRVRDSFLTNNLAGSLDGGSFRQDKMTVLAGRLPRSATGIALSSGMAQAFHATVGTRVTWQFYRLNRPTFASRPARRETFVMTAIVAVPPVLVDQFDQVKYAILPPAATRRVLGPVLEFGWAGPRLRAGLAARIAAANPDGTPGGTYRLRSQRGRPSWTPGRDAGQMGRQPLALAGAAVLSLGLALLSSVRQRRRELALLKALGLTRGQVRSAVGWQASVILVLAAAAGLPLGVACGRWAWTGFAGWLGVVPVTVVPLTALLAGGVALLAVGNALTSVPAAIAARTRPAVLLRSE
jgi:hypothetical protein